LQAKLNKMGVVLLGFNAADDKKIARRFLEKVGATFPTVLDSSPEARKVAYEQYRTSGVPAHYIICNGYVVDSWYGFDTEHARAWAALQKLGLTKAPPQP
jgi:hypothetical protein